MSGMSTTLARLSAAILITFNTVSTAALGAPSTDNKSQAALCSVPFELIDNRIFVDVYLNGEGPFKFIFDTGGCFSITPRIASKLKCKPTRHDTTSGAGEKVIDFQHTTVKQCNLGKLSFQNQDFMIIDYSPIARAFRLPALDGILGSELLKKHIALINYEKREITFSDTAASLGLGAFQKIPCKIVADNPVINGSVNDKAARILVDTGDRSALTLFKAFCKQNKLEKLFEHSEVITTGHGIGGPIPGKLAQVQSLTLSPAFVMHDATARLPVTNGGFNALKGLDASIGDEVLKQFDVAFDYRGKNIYLKKNSHYGEPVTFHAPPK